MSAIKNVKFSWHPSPSGRSVGLHTWNIYGFCNFLCLSFPSWDSRVQIRQSNHLSNLKAQTTRSDAREYFGGLIARKICFGVVVPWMRQIFVPLCENPSKTKRSINSQRWDGGKLSTADLYVKSGSRNREVTSFTVLNAPQWPRSTFCRFWPFKKQFGLWIRKGRQVEDRWKMWREHDKKITVVLSNYDITSCHGGPPPAAEIK